MTIEIVFATLEELMVLYDQHDIKIAGRTATAGGFTFSADAQLVAGIDAGRNLQFEVTLPNDSPLAAASLAGILDDLSRAAALRARSRDAEETLLEPNLPIPVACRAGG